MTEENPIKVEKTILLSEHQDSMAVALVGLILITGCESFILVGSEYELIVVINTVWGVFGYFGLLDYFWYKVRP